MNMSLRPAEIHLHAAVVMAFGLPAFAAEPELPVGAISRLGAHRFVHEGAERVRWLGFVADDRRVFAHSDDSTFCIWDLDSGRKVWHPTEEAQGSLMSAQISADGSVVVVTANGEKIGVMKTADPASIRWLTGAADRSRDLAVARDGSIAASCDGRDILIWNTVSGSIERRLNADESARAVALSPNGRLVAGGGKSIIRLWQITDGKQIGEWPGSPYTLCFDPAARFLVASMSIALSASSSLDTLKLVALPSGQEKWEDFRFRFRQGAAPDCLWRESTCVRGGVFT
jgi:WD40 repeat protein